MKNILIINLIIVGLLASLSIAKPIYAATLEDLNQQKKDLQNSISSNRQQIGSIQDMISSLDTQTGTTQKEIDLTNQIITVTGQDIADTQDQLDQRQKELDQKKTELNKAIVSYYENGGEQSTVEVVVGANNLSDLIDQSQYIQALTGQISTKAQEITQAKADLQSKKDDLQSRENDLKNQKASLVDKQRNLKIQADAKNNLLSQANSEQSQLKAELDNVSAAIYAQRQAQGGYSSGGTGGYPLANDPPCTSGSNCPSDRWGFGVRQCTSYAAWYFNAIEGKSWYNTRPGSGDAGNWPNLAADQGYSVSSTPQAGAIASWPAGGLNAYGHVAIVQSVNGNGTINVSEYNWVKYSYSERPNVSSAGARFIY